MNHSSGTLRARQLETFLRNLSVELDLSKACVSVVDLRDPAASPRAGWRDAEIQPAASVIKLGLLAAAHNAAAEGVPFSTEIKIGEKNMTGTWDPGQYGIKDPNPPLKAGETWTLGRLAEVMITRSDNVAANTLMDLLDRKKVTAFLQAAGLSATYVRHKLSSGAGVDDPDATGLNQMPARDAAALLALIARGKLVSREACAAMHATLAGQLNRGLIAAALPAEAAYAGKTGALSAARNDAAIVRAPGREYALAVYAQLPAAEAVPLIHAVTRAVDGHFSR